MLITKADGTQEEFDPGKLKHSLIRAGASPAVCAEIIQHVENELLVGTTTKDIYQHAFDLLREKEGPLAARYSMRRAVRDLGPSGFPFEDFVMEIFKYRGFEAKRGVMLEGKCVTHEVDLVATKGDEHIAAELKFHNSPGIKSDLKVALYIHARFQDLENAKERNNITDGWLVTNTKFTTKALEYGKCVKMTMVSWNYPGKGNLQDLIEEAGVQPVTALTTLSKHEKKELLDQRVVLCRSLPSEEQSLERLGVSKDRVSEVLTEAHALCGSAEKIE